MNYRNIRLQAFIFPKRYGPACIQLATGISESRDLTDVTSERKKKAAA
jgi:hypothetical protein